MKAHDDLTFNVIGATIESPSQNPPACLYKPRVWGNKAGLLKEGTAVASNCLSLAEGLGWRTAGSPLLGTPSALLREVPLPLSFCGAPPAVIFKYLLILISNNSTGIKSTDSMISIPSDYNNFAPSFMSLDMFQCLLVYSLWELEYNLYPAVG